MKIIKDTIELIKETDGIIGLATFGAVLLLIAEWVYIIATTPISL